MGKTKKEFECLSNNFSKIKSKSKKEKEKFDRFVNILTLQTLLNIQELLRDIKRGLESK